MSPSLFPVAVKRECGATAMEFVSLKPFFRFPLASHFPPYHSRSQSNPCPKRRSQPSAPAVFFNSSVGQTPAVLSDDGPPHVNSFSLLLPIFHCIGGFFLSQLPSVRSWLWGGLDGREGEGFLCCGGIGTLLMSTTAAVSKTHVSPFLWTLAGNPTFMSGLVAWSLAQSMKVLINFFLERRWDLSMLFSSGGMPSSHSALCTALTASVALCHGVADSLFPVCLGFSLIVMYDATGVRRHAGMHAEVLNKIIEDLFQGHPISERKLKELLGHTPSQVFAGAVLGILVAIFCCHGYVVTI